MGAAGKVALLSFLKYLPPDSALNYEMNPKDEYGPWYTTAKTNGILADFYDAYVAAHTKKGTQPKRYPRPQKKQQVGKGAIPVSKFWDWWNKKEVR